MRLPRKDIRARAVIEARRWPDLFAAHLLGMLSMQVGNIRIGPGEQIGD
jgi:hypothetical protein